MAKVTQYGSPFDSWLLVKATTDGHSMKKDDWGLVQINDPTFIWKETPIKNPEKIDTEIECEEFDLWIDKFNKFTDEFKLLDDRSDAKSYYNLIKAAIDKGYKIEDNFEYWLFDYLGKFLETAVAVPF